MDQIAIGRFLKTCRKEKGLTQEALAEQLAVSPKTVSKWECGNGLPEVSLMLPLCRILGISVNELLSGCRIPSDDYREKAESNLIAVMKERKENRKKITICVLISFLCLLSSTTMILLAGFLDVGTGLRIALICLAALVLILGIGICCVLDRDAGYFQCPACHELFIPNMAAYIAGPHTITRRLLKCPCCGKTGYCKKKLSR